VFALVVRFDLRDSEAANRFDGLVTEMLPRIGSEEPGTLIYAVHEVEDAPLSRIFYELYASRAAFEQHEAYPHVRHFLTEKDQYLAGSQVTFLGSPTGKGF
jgi:quinol monooxygenase YgiN